MKKRLTLFGLALLCTAHFFSCEKEYPTDILDHTIAQGRLVDAYTGEPIENGTVYLTKGVGSVIYDSVITKADGRYYFKYDHDLIPVADIWAKADQYLDNSNVAAWSAQYSPPGASPRKGVPVNGRINGYTVRLPPIGWVKYHFKNVNNLEGNFEIRFSPYDSWGVVSWSGRNLDKTYTSIFPSGVDYRIGYAILKDGNPYMGSRDTLFIPHKDTLTYYIEF